VIHHHGIWSSIVAVTRRTIPVFVDEAADVAPVPTAPYAPSGSEELAEAVSTEISRGRNAVLVANHGVVAVGHNLNEALRRAMEVERLANIHVIVKLLDDAQPVDEAAVQRSRQFIEGYRTVSAAAVATATDKKPMRDARGLQGVSRRAPTTGSIFGWLVKALIGLGWGR
jgi:ribulose-5-phosphate 4-epimerase/fuculose-1-phosphate aldolase